MDNNYNYILLICVCVRQRWCLRLQVPSSVRGLNGQSAACRAATGHVTDNDAVKMLMPTQLVRVLGLQAKPSPVIVCRVQVSFIDAFYPSYDSFCRNTTSN